jgi:CubicO group peptidase (beta-lactamase class C family)
VSGLPRAVIRTSSRATWQYRSILRRPVYLLLAVFISASAIGQDSSQIDSIFNPLISSDSPGFAVGVIRSGKLTFSRGYGLADLRTRKPITPETDFRLASVTKQFTAMAVMLLVHDSKLHFDETLTRLFPEFPSYGGKVTVRNLLNHTSGLKPYEEIYEQQTANTPEGKIPQLQDADVLRILEQQNSTEFVPGTRWEYSNSGYAVLAMVVERVSGEPFSGFLQRHIFVPAGMKHTVAFVSGKNEVPNRALGYRRSRDGNAWDVADQSPTSAVLGDGGIYTSIEDLAKWNNALTEHTLLPANEMEVGFTPVHVDGGVRLSDGTPSEYGFGWFLDPYKGHRRTWHDGDTSGFHTSIQRFPDEKLTVVVLANRTDANPRELALKIADLYLK